jgi:hypothetical protein
MDERNIPPGALRWRKSEIDFAAIDPRLVDRDEALFYLVVGASFVETAADLYTANLVAFYRDDAPLRAWLDDEWQWQELQHGAALRAYVEHAWPDFPWEGAYAGFLADYSPLCVVANFKPGPAQELAARCVVETGTASLYRMLHEASGEPVLKRLTGHIYADEVAHYKMFLRYERRYREAEALPRRQIAGALLRRLAETRNEDAYLAFKHIWRHCHPGEDFRDGHYRRLGVGVRALARRHWPFGLTANMLLLPLELPAAALPVARRLTRYAVWGVLLH